MYFRPNSIYDFCHSDRSCIDVPQNSILRPILSVSFINNIIFSRFF